MVMMMFLVVIYNAWLILEISCQKLLLTLDSIGDNRLV